MGRKQICEHIRKPHPFPVMSKWRIECSCGWRGEISRIHAMRDLSRTEAEERLNRLFIDHVPPAERQTYVLVDQRPSRIEGANGVELPTGNMIMPEGLPCTLLQWWEDGDEYHGRVQGFRFGDPVLVLPIGEIRTADGRVFRMA